MRRMRPSRTTTIKVSGPFSLAAALDALESLAPGHGAPDAYEGRHTIGGRQLDVGVRQTGPRRLVLSVTGESVEKSNLDAAEQLVRRMFGLDLDAERFYAEASRDDRVLRRLQSRLPGVRPVTAPTPLAALAFVVLADEHGPERARMVVGRLNGAEVLRSMPVDAARNWICAHGEVGATSADLVLMAGAGRTDVMPKASPQLIAALERYYGVARSEARRRLEDLGQRWGEFSSWAVFLLLEAARRDARAAAV